MISLTRRQFLKGLAALAISSGIKIPAVDSVRKPYVFAGEVVDYIGPHPGGFIGGQVVLSVGKWDGVGFPVTLRSNHAIPQKEQYYDVDLANLNKEVPERFWWYPENKKYPNVHTYVRMKRYGESIEQAIRKMNMASSEHWLASLG